MSGPDKDDIDELRKLNDKKQEDEAFDRMFRLLMLKMMTVVSTPTPILDREVTNINMPIDPDGQVLNLIGDIQSSLNQLRTLIISRSRD